MSELVEFIRGCLDADEQTARRCVAEGVEEPGSHLYAHVHTPFPEDGAASDLADRFNPARVLAEVDAKRAILDEAYRVAVSIDGEWGCCHDEEALQRGGREPMFDGDEFEPLPAYCPGVETVERFARALAQPFRGEPGWRDEWGTQ